MGDTINAPEFLYHYTSIEKLALILKHRTIRLNPLDKMDDLQEQKAADVENLGRFVFVSSWTESATESIPMWKMYTAPEAGVRIKMETNPFLWHGTTGMDLEARAGYTATDKATLEYEAKTFLNLADMIMGGYFSPQAYGGPKLVKMKYINDKAILEPTVASIKDGKLKLEMGRLGMYKNPYWKFQDEWRYIMYFMRLDLMNDFQRSPERFTQSVVNMVNGTEIPPFRYFDLDIDSKCFEKMEITCSPQMTPGNRVILELLVEKFNPSATIKESALTGLI